jgi:hypothetical protein
MTKAPYTMFGKTKNVKLVTYTNGSDGRPQLDNPPKSKWDNEIWIERGEDWYGLHHYTKNGKTVRVVTREDWLRIL